jgi:hypothetical protein
MQVREKRAGEGGMSACSRNLRRTRLTREVMVLSSSTTLAASMSC